VYMYMYMYMYKCMYIYVYMHMYIHTPKKLILRHENSYKLIRTH
jgi:hypothetical protein